MKLTTEEIRSLLSSLTGSPDYFLGDSDRQVLIAKLKVLLTIGEASRKINTLNELKRSGVIR